MKQSRLQVVTLFAALCTTAFFYAGCNKGSDEQKEQDSIIGTWYNESVGQKGNDILKTIIEIQDDATMNVRFEGEDTVTNDTALWTTDGDKFYFAYEAKINSDKTEDLTLEEYNLIKLQWEEVRFKISGNTLTFGNENNRILWEFTKK